MLSAIITPDYIKAQGIQRALNNSNLKTLVYRTDFAFSDSYDFMYHDGFFLHLIDPSEHHVNFCLHLKNVAPGKVIFVLAETDDLEILNSLRGAIDAPVFLPPFAFRNIAGLFQSMLIPGLGHVHAYDTNGVHFKLDSGDRTLCIDDGFSIQLVNKEYFIMKFLFNNQGKIVSKLDLLEFVWGQNLMSSTSTIDVHMSRLRKKLRGRLKFDLIRTVPCAGYMLE